MKQVSIGEGLTLEAVADVAHGRAEVAMGQPVIARLEAGRRVIESHLGVGMPLRYGINTGFGALAEVRIANDKIEQLQQNLIRSHSVGVGTPLEVPFARAVMVLRAEVLAKGQSGVRPRVVQVLLECLNAHITPVIPRKGSVGASGDLAPLAHLALALIGEGEVYYKGQHMGSLAAMQAEGITPITLQAKEGLCLINGTQAMTGVGALVLERAERLVKLCDAIGAMTVDALTDSRAAYDSRIHALRPFEGQRACAANLWRLLEGSEIMNSHSDCSEVQDPYSLRCMPQVHGATRDTLAHVRRVLSVEVDSVTDNPLLFDNGDIVSGGNFHGQPVAFVLDFMGIAVAELANISERRIEQLVNPALSSGLPAFLAPEVGLNSGFMIAQVTAAALVSGNKRLAAPASVDSIPSSANREDHVSMGMHAALDANEILENVETVLGIELLCAAQGIDLRRPLKSSAGVEALHAAVREVVPMLERDRILYPDIQAAIALVQGGALLQRVEDAVGPLA
ncbi:MAG: histidine ammonia-lyase [Myxococcota bacterium]|jgi:histidine ammonia-lyase